MSNKIVLYFTSVSASLEVKKRQQKIKGILDGRKVDYTVEDVASGSEILIKMRKLTNDETALAPQIFNGDEYCGDYEAFNNAIEMDNIDEFLKL